MNEVACIEFATGSEGSASYDLIAGVFAVSAYVAEATSFNVGTTPRDIYRIEGAPEGTVITFRAELALVATESGNTGATALLSEDIDNEARFSSPPGTTVVTIEIPLSHAVGEEFELLYQLRAGASGGEEGGVASIEATLAFRDLPGGASIVSCQGYPQDAPVQIRQATWGQVKSTYR
jgi:hypothetical protein